MDRTPLELAQAAHTFTSMLHAIDAKDWDGVRRAFADRVEMDYSSLFGAPATTVSGKDQIAQWRAFASVFDATQHMTGPIVTAVDGQHVTAATHVRAYHRVKGEPGGDIWMVAGHYQVRLAETGETWKIVAITLTVFYQEGNLAIPDLAKAAAAAAQWLESS